MHPAMSQRHPEGAKVVLYLWIKDVSLPMNSQQPPNEKQYIVHQYYTRRPDKPTTSVLKTENRSKPKTEIEPKQNT